MISEEGRIPFRDSEVRVCLCATEYPSGTICESLSLPPPTPRVSPPSPIRGPRDSADPGTRWWPLVPAECNEDGRERRRGISASAQIRVRQLCRTCARGREFSSSCQLCNAASCKKRLAFPGRHRARFPAYYHLIDEFDSHAAQPALQCWPLINVDLFNYEGLAEREAVNITASSGYSLTHESGRTIYPTKIATRLVITFCKRDVFSSRLVRLFMKYSGFSRIFTMVTVVLPQPVCVRSS